MRMTEFSSSLLGEKYYKINHVSGLSVYVFPKKLTTTYTFFAVRYGSLDASFEVRDDNKRVCAPDGMAHFLEHKMFENADGSDSFAHFAALGADANAYTSYNRTAYLFSCTEHFDEALDELLRFVMQPHFTEASVKKEQGIIAEEIRMYEDNPWEQCLQKLLEAMYKSHPVRKNICGTLESIRKITPAVLDECYRAFYTPTNMALVVCGDVTPDEVMAAVDRQLPQKEVPSRVERITEEDRCAVDKSYVCTRMQVSKPIFAIGIKDRHFVGSPVERLRRELAMTMLDEILFSRSEPFYNGLFERGVITPSFGAGYSCAENFAFHCISGESDTPEDVLQALKEYLQEVRQGGISEEAFERCRRVMYADEVRAYDSTEEIASRLLSFAFEDVDMFSCLEILQSITRKDLENLLATAFDEDCFALAVILPIEYQEKRSDEN